MNTRLEIEFWNASRDIRRFEINIGTCAEFAASCHAFFNQMGQAKELQRMLFIDKHYDLLLKMEDFIKNTTIPIPFLKFLQSAPHHYTVVFEEFIKGITYFASQRTRNPIYHRLAPCKRVETCFIELLVFEEIYKDLSNLAEPICLENDIKKDYKACFPSMSINVQVSGYVQSMPTCLEISRFKNGRLASVEKYRKQVIGQKYDYFVEGILIKPQKSEKRKIQCFEKKSKWECPRAPCPQ